jgi:hypothetical protein
VFLTPCENNPGGRINSYLAKAVLAEPVERKFLKALKNSDIEALDFAAQLDEGVREGWITADERKQLEELRVLTLETITVDDFDTHELRSAGLLRSSSSKIKSNPSPTLPCCAREGAKLRLLTSMSTSYRQLYNKISRKPFGHWLFSRLVCFKAPYFGSIKPRMDVLEPGRGEATIAPSPRSPTTSAPCTRSRCATWPNSPAA